MHNRKVVNVEPVWGTDDSVTRQTCKRQNTNGVRCSYGNLVQHYRKKLRGESFTSIQHSCYPPNVLFVDRLRFSVRPGLTTHSLEKISRDTLCRRSSSLWTDRDLG